MKNKGENKVSLRQILMPLIALISLTFMLIALTLSWFSSNTNVSADNINVKALKPNLFDVGFNSSEVDLSNMIPGETRSITITVSNSSKVEENCKFTFSDFDCDKTANNGTLFDFIKIEEEHESNGLISDKTIVANCQTGIENSSEIECQVPLPATDDDVNVTFYFTLSSEATNDYQGLKANIGQITVSK